MKQKNFAERNGAVAALRGRVLKALGGTGPLAVEEIPRAWPVLREHVRMIVGELLDDGLLEPVPAANGSNGPARLRLSRNGRRALTGRVEP